MQPCEEVRTVRNFSNDLRMSESPEVQEFWLRHYRRQWPDMVNVLRNSADNVAQRRGVDAVVFDGIDKEWRVDEKGDYHEPNNFFIEYSSADTTRAPGWINKSLACDFIAYGFIKHDICFFLPWVPLRLAWMQSGAAWMERYKKPPIENHGYNTHGLAVPINVVLNAVVRAMRSQVVRPQ
jgi:hypothetical protein